MARGFTQEQLAEVLDVTPVSVRRWEIGLRLPSLPDLEVIVSVLGLPSLTGTLSTPMYLDDLGHGSLSEQEMLSRGRVQHRQEQWLPDGGARRVSPKYGNR